MTPREIIAEAWAVTREQKLIRRWGFFSSFFETLFLAKLLIYQAWFIYGFFVGKPVGFFDDVIWLAGNVSTTTFITILVIFFILLGIELIFPSFAKGPIIGFVAKAVKKEELKGGPVLAFYNFFPMLGIHEMFLFAGLANIVTFSSLALRYMEGDMKFLVVGFLFFFWLLSTVLKFLASFAEPAVVINRVSVFSALGTSFKLIISYTGHVMFLWLLLFVISIRIVVNAVFALLIPAIVIGIGMLLINVLSPGLTLLIAASIGFILILILSYFFAYLHIFKEAVWTITYMELKKYKDLAVIEEDEDEKK